MLQIKEQKAHYGKVSGVGRQMSRATFVAEKMAQVGPIVRGSRVTARRGNHVAHQLTVSIQGTHTVYVPLRS